MTYKLVTTKILGSWFKGVDAKMKAMGMQIDMTRHAAPAKNNPGAGAAVGW